MNRLRQPGDSDYDVLGISPRATEEEINSAFSRLINEQGYRVGVPLERQWARAREIRAAHARLGDPETRKAYDESLNLSSDSAPWVSTASDAATDTLDSPALVEEEGEPLENGPVADDAVSDGPGDWARASARPRTGPGRALDPDADEAPWFHDRPPPSYLAPAGDDHLESASAAEGDDDRRVSIRAWGAATAGAMGLGVVLLTSWPGGDVRPSRQEKTPEVIARPGQVAQQPARAPGILNGTPPVRQKQPAPSAFPLALTAVPGRPAELQRKATTQDNEKFAHVNRAEPLPSATGAAERAAPASEEALSESPKASQTRELATAPAKPGASAPAQAYAPPHRRIAPASVGASAAAARSGGPVRRPARWVGGGPTDADNYGGRYRGAVGVQVTIGQQGRVSNCFPVRGSGNAGLDALTCRLVRERARFDPALDGQGRPTIGEAYTTIVWGRRRRY